MSTKDALKAMCRREYETVDLGDGLTVRVQTLTEREHSRFQASLLDGKGRVSAAAIEGMKRRLIAACAVDESGSLLWPAGSEDEIGDLPASVADAIYTAAAAINKLDGEGPAGN